MYYCYYYYSDGFTFYNIPFALVRSLFNIIILLYYMANHYYYYYYTNDRFNSVAKSDAVRADDSAAAAVFSVSVTFFFFYSQTRHFHLFQLHTMVGTSSGDGVGAVAGGESQTRRAITT